jgi:hypothetical protein
MPGSTHIGSDSIIVFIGEATEIRILSGIRNFTTEPL